MISKLQLKYIQSLGQKKYRDLEGVFIGEGPRLVNELLETRITGIEHVYALEPWVRENENLVKGIDVTVIDEKELERISLVKTPNQVVALIKKFETKTPVVKGTISLVLDSIQDPGNLGTIIRIADWFGIPQIICSPDCVDMYNPKVVQSTVGSISRVNCFYADLPGWLGMQIEITIYAATLDGKDVTKMSGVNEGLIIIGNEARGISNELIQFAHERITIPKKGKAESLNAAVATGIILSCLAI